jgi:hypothetical protein
MAGWSSEMAGEDWPLGEGMADNWLRAPIIKWWLLLVNPGMSECLKSSPTLAFLLLVNCVSPAPAFQHQGQSGYCSGIFNQSMGARNQEGIGLSYWPARLHGLAELVPWNRLLLHPTELRCIIESYAAPC